MPGPTRCPEAQVPASARPRQGGTTSTARETHEIATGLSQLPLTPAEQAARKLWLRSNGERERDDRASFGSQQYGWDAEDGADSVVHMPAARRKAPLATNVVLPAEVAAELEHDAARQAQIEVEVMASRDEHGDMSRLAGAERFKDVWGEDTP